MLNQIMTPKEDEQSQTDFQKAPEHTKLAGITNYGFLIGIGVTIGLVVLCVWLLLDTMTVGARAASQSYQETMEKSEQDIYNKFYEEAYTRSEKSYHVRNQLSIRVEEIKEEQKLEVLEVQDTDYMIVDELTEKGMNVWAEYSGKGVYTVNLKMSEFVIDHLHQHVLIRLPRPELTNFTLLSTEIKYFEDKGKTFGKHSVAEGFRLMKETEAEMDKKMRKNLKGVDQDNYNMAKKSAKNLITTWVKALNPEAIDLKVEIEFMEE